MVILEFQVEMKTIDRFRKVFTTDKHITIIQWEEIMENIEKYIKHHIRGNDSDNENEFTIDDLLKVTFEVVPRRHSRVNFDKLLKGYKFDWFMKIKIERCAFKTEIKTKKTLSVPDPDPPKKADPSLTFLVSRYQDFNKKDSSGETNSNEQLPTESSEHTTRVKKSEVPNKKSKAKLFASDENYNLKSDDEPQLLNHGDEKQTATARSKKRQIQPSNENSTKDPKLSLGIRSHKKIKMDTNQPKVESWTKKAEKVTAPTQKSAKSSTTDASSDSGQSSTGSKTNKAKPSTSALVSSPKKLHADQTVNTWDTLTMKRMENFIKKMEDGNEIKNKRREELKNFTVLNCQSLSNEELKRFVFLSFTLKLSIKFSLLLQQFKTVSRKNLRNL